MKTTAAALFLLTLLCAPAKADLLYGIVSNGELHRIDTTTLTSTLIGDTGLERVGGLALDNSGVLYGLDGGSGDLLIFDQTTAANTVVGNIGRPVGPSTGLANDWTTDTLYGATREGSGSFSDSLVTVDKASASATLVGTTASEGMVGLSFDKFGQLWGIENGTGSVKQLVAIDKDTAARTPIRPPNNTVPNTAGAFAVGSSGTFWVINNFNQLFSVSRPFGTATLLGTIDGLPTRFSPVVGGLTSAVPIRPIPEPGAAFLAVLGLAGVIGVRKTRC